MRELVGEDWVGLFVEVGVDCKVEVLYDDGVYWCDEEESCYVVQ
ncbi:MAG: hypothetical protein O7C59_04090 [Rickettsia endosymbiont of Ixodes persulcatus]|nr:hypothetical protein [Rickettsia endosymbiont of Ixodes persulcatus]